MIVYERRACAILYNLLRARADTRPFLMPANICPVVPMTFVEAGQSFELVDIDEQSLELHRGSVIARLQERPRAYGGLLFVRPYGSERDPALFLAEVRAVQPDLLVIDDKCLCRPAWTEDAVQSPADATLFSTGHTKYADLGDGGFAVLQDGIAYERQQSQDGWLDLRAPERPWTEHLRLMIEETQRAGDHKRALNTIYERHLPAEIQFHSDFQGWRFNIRVPDSARLIATIFAAGLFASSHYASLGNTYRAGPFPVAERVHSGVVNLFNDRHFDEERARRVADIVLRHVESS